MIIITEKAKEKLNELNISNFYVVADFDKTISTKNSKTTFGLYADSGLYGKEYNKKRTENYEFYRPLEVNPQISDEEKYHLMEEWQNKSYRLMLEYKVRESDIRKILTTTNLLELRDGATDFISHLNSFEIPLIINSAGCGNFIEEALKLARCYTNNVFIHSNMLQFRNDVIIDSITDIIHSMNKNNIKVPSEFYDKIRDKRYAVLIGDQLSDLNMVSSLPKQDVISFGFLESNVEDNEELFNEQYDVVLKGSESFKGIQKILKLK